MTSTGSGGGGRLAFVFCVEAGPLEAQAVLLAESVRRFAGAYRGAPVYAVAPRPGRRPARATVAALEAIDVAYLERDLNLECPEYGSANRLAVAAHVERTTGHERLAVLDTDTFFAAEPLRFELPPGVAAAVRPVDVKGMCTTGPGDPDDAYWRELCAVCGVAYEGLPWVTTATGDAVVKASYNGGLLVVRSAEGILGRAWDYFLLGARAGLRSWLGERGAIRASTGIVPPAAAAWWGTSQAATSLALWSGPRQVELLPAGYDYPLHQHCRLPPATVAAAFAHLVHVHYHYLLAAPDAATAGPLLAAGTPLAPEVADWLRSRLPLRPPAPPRRGAARQLVISGMHRSATSLVASAFERAGVDVGGDLGGPMVGNPWGHYEDPDFHRLHEDMLAAAGCTSFTAFAEVAPPAGSPLRARAESLVAARSAPLWGWKDPRTCLFLELWHSLLPEASYLFLFRHPLAVALSLWRRNSDPELRDEPLLALDAWEAYNRRLLEFTRRHRGRCFLAETPAATADLEALVARVAQRFDLPLHPPRAADLVRPGGLAGPLPLLDDLAERLLPVHAALYRELREEADLVGQEARGAAGGAPAAAAGAGAHEDLAPALTSVLVVLLERRQATTARHHRDVERLEGALAGARGDLGAAAVRVAATEARAAERVAAAEARAAAAERRAAELAESLAAIEGARVFSLVRGWWRLRRLVRVAMP